MITRIYGSKSHPRDKTVEGWLPGAEGSREDTVS